MDFTSSMEFGNSILANIENAEKNYMSNRKTNTNFRKKETATEVIEESPTNNKSTKGGPKHKEHSNDALTQSRLRRRALRKNKSDSMIQSRDETKLQQSSTSKENENFSDYFNTPMEVDILTAPKKGISAMNNVEIAAEVPIKRARSSLENEPEPNPVNGLDDMFTDSIEFSDQIRFSLKSSQQDCDSIVHIDDSSFSSQGYNAVGNVNLEQAMCSEELGELGLKFCSESLFGDDIDEKAHQPVAEDTHAKELTFVLANEDIDNLIVDMSTQMNIENTNDVQKLPKIESDEIINTEQTSFLISSNYSKDNSSISDAAALLPAKKEVLSYLRVEETSFKASNFMSSQSSKSNKSKTVVGKVGDLNLSKCTSRVLTWSLSTDDESPRDKVETEKILSQALANKKELVPKKDPQLPDQKAALKNITNWNLPDSIVKEYHAKGIREMFDWQAECLSNTKVLFDHANLVYSAPTSAGKTLVSELLTIKTVIERKKKALIILPFISVVREKMSYLQDLLTSSGYRVDGFCGGYTPAGGFDSIHVAICTIEKANSIVNKLLERNKLEDIGIIVVDEIHLVSDPGRGYILELLLAKVIYICRKYSINIQIVGMSATLSNIILLQKWLHAEFFVTHYRPVELQEMIKVGTKIYNNKMELIRELKCEQFSEIGKDQDHIAHLCIETIIMDCSVVVFCPSKDWCETLCVHLAKSIWSVGNSQNQFSEKISSRVRKSDLEDVRMQLKSSPAGLDPILAKTISYGCAFHHAGLTSEERDIIESNFKSGALKVLVATSTLSSGVNLPARRVIIRSPLFAGKKMNPLTYKQMIGRAGRTGKDSLGESILICTETNFKTGKDLVCSELLPIQSCLSLESSMPLKRALLEVISSGIVTTKDDVNSFLECTLLHTQKLHCTEQGDAVEVHPLSGNRSDDDEGSKEGKTDPLNDSLQFLVEYEFIRLQMNEETSTMTYVPTRLGMACLSSSLPPNDGLLLFSELQKSRRCFVLESELHAVYLVTPYSVCYQLQDIDWLLYLDLHEKMSTSMKRVAELVGVKESFLVKAMRGHAKLDYKMLQIHKRFYTALALQELVNEVPLSVVSEKYKCSRGLLQSLQQMSSTFAGIVTSFCGALNWALLALIVGEFKERLFFGVHRDLIDLMRIPELNGQKARALFNAGVTNLVELANAEYLSVEKILLDSISFDSEKQHENECEYEANKRNLMRCLYITGKVGLTVRDIAKLLISSARQYLELEIGVEGVKWNNTITDERTTENSRPTQIVPTATETGQEKIDQLESRSCEEPSKPSSVSLNRIKTINDVVSSTSKPNSNEEINPQILKTTLALPESNSCGEPSSKLIKLKSKEATTSQHLKTNSKDSVTPTINDLVSSTSKPKSNEGIKPQILKTTSALSKSNSRAEPNSKLSKLKSKEATTSQHLKTNSKDVVTPKIVKSKLIISDLSKVAQRRSPRNHTAKNANVSSPKSPQVGILKQTTKPSPNVRKEEAKNTSRISDIFNDSIIDINSQIAKALDTKHFNSPKPKTKVDREPTSPINVNKSIEEITDSQTPKNTPKLGANSTRMLRSRLTQKKTLTRSSKLLEDSETKSVKTEKPKKDSCDSIEISDCASSSLLNNPMHLNASHILSTSKIESSSASFKSISIIDVCGDSQLFEKSVNEWHNSTHLGLSVSVQRLTNKKRPMIGANLLINQIQTGADDNGTDFEFDDGYYITGLSICADKNVVYFLNFQNRENENKIERTSRVQAVVNLLQNEKLVLRIFDAKEQMKTLQKCMPELKEIKARIEDPKVGNWLLEPDKEMSLKSIVQTHAPECGALISLAGTCISYNSLGLNCNSSILGKIRSAVEACVSLHVLESQLENLERIANGNLKKFFHELEMPTQYALWKMECIGFPVDLSSLGDLSKQILEVMKKLEQKMYELHGSRFNLTSTSAVARVLGLHKKPNGRVSTAKQILEKMDSPMANYILNYRKLGATLNKTIQPLIQNARNGRIHGNSISFTTTGRISMHEPNLQNVAKDFTVDIEGSESILISCRSSFACASGIALISVDFCQLEMRILTHLSGDNTLMKIMNSDEDIFRAIAAKWNKIPLEEVSERLRNGTKQMCYGIIYGMGLKSLAENLKCDQDEAATLCEQFHSAYPGIRQYTNKVMRFAKQNGYVETITGRRRYLAHITSADESLKGQAERQALNTTIQGSAADIAKKAIIRIERNIEKYSPKIGLTLDDVKLVLHLHDELIFEVPEHRVYKIAKILRTSMENSAQLSVPLRVKLKAGKSWGTLLEI